MPEKPKEASGGSRKLQEAPGGPRRPTNWRAKHVRRALAGAPLSETNAAPKRERHIFFARGARRVPFLPRIWRRGPRDVHVERRNVDVA
eukprot:8763334-Pyramimonas_sp.AAC.1